jgi:hypothetical protein
VGINMQVKRSHHGYPVFSMPQGVETWRPGVWSEMLSALGPDYLNAAGRLPGHRKVRRVDALDCVVFSSEGDECVLALVALSYCDGDSSLLFLPLARTVLPAGDQAHWLPIHSKLFAHPELVAFGIETESDFFGKRDWVVYDGFLDDEVPALLLNLFWQEANFYTLSLTGCGYGAFVFRTDLAHQPILDIPTVRFDVERNLAITTPWGTLSILRDLRPAIVDTPCTQAASVGRIEHQRVSAPSTTIGLLTKAP